MTLTDSAHSQGESLKIYFRDNARSCATNDEAYRIDRQRISEPARSDSSEKILKPPLSLSRRFKYLFHVFRHALLDTQERFDIAAVA